MTSEKKSTQSFQDQVSELTRSIQSMNVQDPYLFLSRAKAYEALEQYDKAFIDLRIALSLDSTNKEAVESLQRLMENTSASGRQIKDHDQGVVTSLSSLLATAVESDASDHGKRHNAARVLAGSSSSQDIIDYVSKEPKWISSIFKAILTQSESQSDSSELSYRFCLLQLLSNLTASKSLNESYFDSLKSITDEEMAVFLGTNDAPSVSVATSVVVNIYTGISVNKEDTTSQITRIFELFIKRYTDTSLTTAVRSSYHQGLLKFLGNSRLSHLFLSLPSITQLFLFATNPSTARTDDAHKQMIRLLAHAFIHLDLSREADKSFCKDMYKVVSDLLYKSDSELAALIIFSILFQAHPEVGACIFVDQEGWFERVFETIDLSYANSKKIDQAYLAIALACALQGIAIACNVPKVRKILSTSESIKKTLLSLTSSAQTSKSLSDNVKSSASLVLVKLMTHEKELRPLLLDNDTILNAFLDDIKRGASQIDPKASDPSPSPGSTTTVTTDTSIVSAVESLTYLSSLPKIKEKIVHDNELVTALGQLSIHPDRATQYGVAAMLANVCAYRQKLTEEEKQMQKLQGLSLSKGKNAVVEDPLDSDSAVEKRVNKLVEKGCLELILKPLIKSPSPNIRESIGSVLVSITTQQKLRGPVIKHIGVKPILALATQGTDAGMQYAAHALSKITITTDPTIAYPGETSIDAIRPISFLLQPEQHPLRQFEALMALTNLLSISDHHRSRFLSVTSSTLTKDTNSGIGTSFSWVENLQISENKLIRRASTELLCNLVFHPAVTAMFLDPTLVSTHHRLKLTFALSDPLIDDPPTRRAASGLLAILSSVGESALPALFPTDPQKSEDLKRRVEIIMDLIKDKEIELVHRGAEIVKNVVVASGTNKDIAERFIKAGVVPLFKQVFKTILSQGQTKKGPMDGIVCDTVKEALLAFRSLGFE